MLCFSRFFAAYGLLLSAACTQAPLGETSSDHSAAGLQGPSIEGCPVFPPDNPWNRDVSGDPVDTNSEAYIAFIQQSGGGTHIDPSLTRDGTKGIPFIVVDANEPRVPVTFHSESQSDPGPYPIPGDAPIEGGDASHGDRHVIAIERDACMLYELFAAYYGPGGWSADSGAVFDLRSNALRRDYHTSADAAGLPIFPGLIRYDEVYSERGIRHALRFTASVTQRGFVHPATHYASAVMDPNAPPMGMRIRLKQSFDISGYTGAARAILEALKKYGAFLADNGLNWTFEGVPHASWNEEELDQLRSISGDAFEVVELGEIQH
jgi:hypothetical protein